MTNTHHDRSPWGRWRRFWFAPADPTTLGIIRLVTGLMVLYTHAAYCWDLRAFFGPGGWHDLAAVNRERHQTPTVLAPMTAWDDRAPGAHVPEYPHRKRAVMAWLRRVTADPGRVDPTLRYLDRAQASADVARAQDLLAYVVTLSPDPAVRKAQMLQLVTAGDRPDGPRKDYEVAVPQHLRDAPADQRASAAAEIEALYAALPADDTDRKYVLNHLIEMDLFARHYFLAFIRDAAALPAADRDRRLDYLDYWNQEERYTYRTGYPIFSLWYHVTDPAHMAVAHGAVLVVMAMFTAGLFTRVTSVLTWLAAVSYIHRTQQVLFGMDTMMNILLIYLMVGNSGAALSADRLIARYRAARHAVRRAGTVDAPARDFLRAPPPSPSAGLALRLLQVHFCFIYMAAGLSKLKGAAWWNTNAYWDTLVNPEFTLVHFHWYERLVRGFVEFRPAYHAAAAAAVVFTFAAEIGLPFLVWTRLRPYAVMMGVMLHAGVAVFMGLWVFSLLMMTMLLGYLPGRVVRQAVFGEPSADRLTVRIDPGSWRQARAAAAIAAADFDGQVAVVPGDGFAVEAGGRALTGPAAARELFARLTWLKGFGSVLRLPVVGPATVRLVTGAGRPPTAAKEAELAAR